jgi:hypothetical protein
VNVVVETEAVVAAVAQARDVQARAIAWIVDRVGPDGCPPGSARLNGYYRVPWALSAAGRPDDAVVVLDWIEREALDLGGDLLPGPPQTPFVATVATYPLAQIALGAWQLERYDLARAILDRIEAAYIDPVTGGAFAERPEARRTGRQDLLNTTQAGMAFITAGRTGVADGAYRWLRRLWDAQPVLPERLYTSWDAHGLMTEVEPGASSWAIYTDFHTRRQQFYNPGMAAAFLARYADVTRSAEPVALARDLLRLNEAGAEFQFDHTDNVQICKYGWGVSSLLEVTGATDLVPAILRMADWYAASQRDDGSWVPSPFLAPEPDDADAVGKTAEHLLHVSVVIRALRSWLARPSTPGGA